MPSEQNGSIIFCVRISPIATLKNSPAVPTSLREDSSFAFCESSHTAKELSVALLPSSEDFIAPSGLQQILFK
ncbi:hypothetical protein Mp_8g11430 [Marchantia polymorpha subsp. ruderalis]|uniref:Uncharacterized protein n=1 Tax=Marchantia polymorpha TaxID=3197 RepID=A0A2R6XMF5_MARPO|nr:hypothetical protein MARPO_0008s0074 [Marchantia polymorpha]BBN19528.1 hypothetical protein Mp_8g11430 [Marchantia polymorpha subsp. ruderalis]|eukprot:PTQ47297.1 hypothetical protein MARPO_0008s0074 [Marchantia polymorpha]